MLGAARMSGIETIDSHKLWVILIFAIDYSAYVGFPGAIDRVPEEYMVQSYRQV